MYAPVFMLLILIISDEYNYSDSHTAP